MNNQPIAKPQPDPDLSSIPPWNVIALVRSARALRLAEETVAKRNPHLQRAMEQEKRFGQKVAVWSRTIALLVVAVLLVYLNPNPDVLYYLALIAVFIALGWAQLRVGRVGQSRVELGLIFLDLVLLAFTLLVPNPFLSEDWPTAAQYRIEGFVFFFLFLAAATLAYSWRTVLTIGVWASVIWIAAMVLIALFGHVVPELSEGVAAVFVGREDLFEFYDPNSVGAGLRIQEIVVFLLVTAILGLRSWRSNHLLMQQAQIAAERANLSRYFPPTMVDDLARHAEPLGKVRSQEIAVLFADIVGFTKFAESNSPDDVVAVLRRFHAILEEAVFAHHGTLDKYLGDGIMATFGTPKASPRDAANALTAAIAMCDAVAAWNRERTAQGQQEIRISIGLHFGPVVLGDIGTERRLEFAAIGDTVNVASRLENATRQLDCSIVASKTLVEQVRRAAPDDDVLHDLRNLPQLDIRGKSEPMDVFTR